VALASALAPWDSKKKKTPESNAPAEVEKLDGIVKAICETAGEAFTWALPNSEATYSEWCMKVPMLDAESKKVLKFFEGDEKYGFLALFCEIWELLANRKDIKDGQQAYFALLRKFTNLGPVIGTDKKSEYLFQLTSTFRDGVEVQPTQVAAQFAESKEKTMQEQVAEFEKVAMAVEKVKDEAENNPVQYSVGLAKLMERADKAWEPYEKEPADINMEIPVIKQDLANFLIESPVPLAPLTEKCEKLVCWTSLLRAQAGSEEEVKANVHAIEHQLHLDVAMTQFCPILWTRSKAKAHGHEDVE